MEWFTGEDGIRRNRFGETHPVDTLKILGGLVRDKKVDEPIKEVIKDQWNALPSQVREPISTAGAMVGTAVENTLDKSRKGLLGPGPFVASRLLQGIDKASDWATNREGLNLTDITRMSPSTTKLVTEMMIMKNIPKVYRAARTSQGVQNYVYDRGQTLRSNIDRMSKDLTYVKNLAKKGKTAYQERFSKDPSKRVIDTKAQVVDSVFNESGAIIRRARAIYRNNPDAGWTAAIDAAKQLPKYAANAKLYIPPSERIGTQKGEPLMTTTGGDDGLVPEWLFSQKGTQFDKYRSDRLGLDKPPGMTPQQERIWFAKVTYPRVKDEVLAQGGTELQAKDIYEDHRKNFLPYAKGGSGMVATISELNRMAEQYAPGIQLRTETYTKNGEEYYRWRFKDKDGKHTRWDLKRVDVDGIVKEYSKTQWAKDHMIPVMDKKRIGGGYIGADNEFNLEPLLQFLNIQKSNTTQLYPGLLKESGVPETFSEYINMKLYPQNYEGMFVPQKWVENFQKIVLAEYYEKTKGLQSANKKRAVMEKLIRLHSARFKDPAIVKGLEMMEEAIGQQVMKNMEEGVAAGNEVPAWLGLLQKPPGGWNSTDPWWTSLSKDAQTRYKYIYDYNQRTILKEPYKRPPFRQDRKDE